MEFSSLTLRGPCVTCCGIKSDNDDSHAFLVSASSANPSSDLQHDQIYRVEYCESTHAIHASAFWDMGGRIKHFAPLSLSRTSSPPDSSGGGSIGVCVAYRRTNFEKENTVQIVSLPNCRRRKGSKENEGESDVVVLQTMNLSSEPAMAIDDVRQIIVDPLDSGGGEALPSSASDRLIVLGSGGFCLYSTESSSDFRPVICKNSSSATYCSAALSPHHSHQFASVSGRLDLWDLRTATISASTSPLLSNLRSVDFNPNSVNEVLTGGEDATIRIWDIRKLNRTLKVFSDLHSHWITCARFNPCHDPLVVTGSSDHYVRLWHLPIENNGKEAISVSNSLSPPLSPRQTVGELKGGESKSNNNNRDEKADWLMTLDGSCPARLVGFHDNHEDSVVELCWSGTDAWVFASLSYEGRVVVSQVPQDEKYRILF